MTTRHFIDNAPAVTLSTSINGTATSFNVSAVAGLPSTPFAATIDRGTASAEQIDVTNITGTTLTVTRNINGLGAFSHAAGAALEHTATARDYSEANTHVNATSGVHGVTGDLVGTTDTQTLSGKTLTDPTINAATLSGTLAGSPTFSQAVTFDDGLVAAKEVSGSDRVVGYLKVQDFTDATAAGTAYAALENAGEAVGDLVRLDNGANGGIGGLYVYAGAWRPAALSSGLTLIQSGTTNITPVANTPTSQAITFATAFASTPVVTVAINGTVPGTVITGCSVSNISTTGCTIWVTRTNTTVTTISWIAVQ